MIDCSFIMLAEQVRDRFVLFRVMRDEVANVELLDAIVIIRYRMAVILIRVRYVVPNMDVIGTAIGEALVVRVIRSS